MAPSSERAPSWPTIADEVEVALVDADLLDARAQLSDELPDLARALPVARVVGRHEHRVRTAPARLGRAHARADPERARLVARRRDDAAALGLAPDDSGRPRSSGWSSCSHAAKNASRSRCAITALHAARAHAGALRRRPARTPRRPRTARRTAVRLSGACRAARARPEASQPHDGRCLEAARALDLDAQRLRRERRRAAYHHVQQRRILRVAPRLRDPQRRARAAPCRSARAAARRHRASARAAARCGRAARSRRAAAASSVAPGVARAELAGRSPRPTPAVRCRPSRASRARASPHRAARGTARRAAGSRPARRPGRRRPGRPAMRVAAPMSNTNPRAGASVRPGAATSMPPPKRHHRIEHERDRRGRGSASPGSA